MDISPRVSQSDTLSSELPRVSQEELSVNELLEKQVKSIPPTKSSQHLHDQNASILLIGMGGAGKTTLAMIAAFALGRRYVDFSKYFEKQSGKPPVKYAQLFGLESYRKYEVEVARNLLQNCPAGHIIEGFNEFGGSAQWGLFKDYAATNPVIYVRRDKQELRKVVASEDSRFDQWYKHRDTIYSSCASFEFYNLSVQTSDSTTSSGYASTLKLKPTEVDFVRFLRRMLGRPPLLLRSNGPFSSTHTYALQVSFSWLRTFANPEELESGSDAINFVIDVSEDVSGFHDHIAYQMAYLRRHSRLPIIFEFRRPSQQSSTSSSFLDVAFRVLPDFVVIDLAADISQIMPVLRLKSNIKKIGAYHLERPWPVSLDDSLWSDLHVKARSISCDAIRISRNATKQADNLASTVFAAIFAEKYKLPIIAYNTGKLGRTSVCLNPVLTPTVPRSLSHEGVTLPQANSALYSCFMATNKRFAIFGKEVMYSLSPAMHNAAYQATGMPHLYDTMETDSFSDIHQLLEDDGCAGVAVTLPFKTDAWLLLDQRVSEDAREIGAVNTITIHRGDSVDGSLGPVMLKGHNTDHVGLRECGMARASLYACQALGVKNFCIHNRTLRNAEKLSHSWSSTHPGTQIHVLENMSSVWPAHMNQPTIIISTIPAHKHDDETGHDQTIPKNWLQSRTGGVYIELAYSPLMPESKILKQIRSLPSRAWIAVEGLDVLVEQGIAQFEIFTGRPAPIHVMRRAVRDGWRELTRNARRGVNVGEAA